MARMETLTELNGVLWRTKAVQLVCYLQEDGFSVLAHLPGNGTHHISGVHPPLRTPTHNPPHRLEVLSHTAHANVTTQYAHIMSYINMPAAFLQPHHFCCTDR